VALVIGDEFGHLGQVFSAIVCASLDRDNTPFHGRSFMNPIYLEYIKIALLLYVVGLLNQNLRYMKMIWGKIFDIHVAVALREDPKKYGGGRLNEKES
jgi:hypothetical protein